MLLKGGHAAASLSTIRVASGAGDDPSRLGRVDEQHVAVGVALRLQRLGLALGLGVGLGVG